MGRIYKGIILTNHALERMGQRAITQEQVWATINRPDRSRYSKEQSSFIYNKTFGREMVEVVGSKNERKEWVVVSVWSRPIERLEDTTHQYYRHVAIIDWFLDKIAEWFARKK